MDGPLFSVCFMTGVLFCDLRSMYSLLIEMRLRGSALRSGDYSTECKLIRVYKGKKICKHEIIALKVQTQIPLIRPTSEV